MCTKKKTPKPCPYYHKLNYTAYHTNGDGLLPYTEAEELSSKLPELKVYMHDSGMMCTHNIPCTVCKTNHAVFNLADGVAEPCRECRRLGWSLTYTNPVTRKETLVSKFFDWVGTPRHMTLLFMVGLLCLGTGSYFLAGYL